MNLWNCILISTLVCGHCSMNIIFHWITNQSPLFALHFWGAFFLAHFLIHTMARNFFLLSNQKVIWKDYRNKAQNALSSMIKVNELCKLENMYDRFARDPSWNWHNRSRFPYKSRRYRRNQERPAQSIAIYAQSGQKSAQSSPKRAQSLFNSEIQRGHSFPKRVSIVLDLTKPRSWAETPSQSC